MKSNIYNHGCYKLRLSSVETYIPLKDDRVSIYSKPICKTYGVLKSSGATENKILDPLEERLGILAHFLIFGGRVEILDVFLKVLNATLRAVIFITKKYSYRAVSPGLQGAIIAGFDGFNYRHHISEYLGDKEFASALPGTYWYPPRGATTVVSLARRILLLGLGGKRP